MDISTHKIMLVDDEPGILKITGTLLSEHFANELIMTSSPAKALEIIEKEDIAVILTDLYMPKISGAQLLQEAHRIHPHTVGILVTARATKEVILDGMNKGYLWKCLEKPWVPADLVALTQDALELYGQNAEPDQTAQNVAVDNQPESGRRKIVIQKSGLRRTRLPRKSVQLSLKGKALVFGKTKEKKRGTKGLLVRRGTSASGTGGRGQSLRNIRIRRKGGNVVTQEQKRGVAVSEVLDNRYSIEEKIKEGGAGIIYKAQDKLLNMPVAIKVLSDELSGDRESMSQLLYEARYAMQLSHKHIVRLHNINESSGFYYLVMEYIDGMTLREMLQGNAAMDVATVAQIAEVMGDALGYAHRHGIYHRDLKPDNVMVSEDGVLKIIDFGLACLARQVRQHQDICGTPFYMSPEEIEGVALDQRVDIYALGVMLHELLTGRLPLDEEKPPEDFMHFEPACSCALPEGLRAVLQRAMAVDRDLRWTDVVEFTEAFCEASRQESS